MYNIYFKTYTTIVSINSLLELGCSMLFYIQNNIFYAFIPNVKPLLG